MIVRLPTVNRFARIAAVAVACAFAAGCASIADNAATAFVDPAKYDLYSCVQLRAVRQANTKRIDELQMLMAKARTGAGGPVISEVAYGNDLLATKAQAKLADDVWMRHRCDSETLPPDAPDAAATARDLNKLGKRRAGNQ
ncbi:twin-arginine translocation pathway signal [Bradyrhizobium sp. U87765 SZCCT0131]|uniref:twin-arginine translocation pathway signal n=1 Tax=unclassified Bradyrhizobium TaxID=2631580 RepID=UPI001BABA7BD|nr:MULTISPECIES: twin-arginine translocation pathway signal [unclassified Bradyrhizobium]MBR1222924.1 twin-arginine translocation pathway signal [Bradyrhizobium sp. U87765 SZCCT0131]MBR1262660.1 twin-arginine translocation pathway signal [Bradyrhizobium sp. U87765 SZCCT0134]MBR1308868.1 twin-arginine translocation pathway signal [Bradyrhizobium sp. U87765 SZCCT0110]MBR1318442.1 twin-arginine translocation pathway signal [Bradyrhizobium sp. U87765 SZCCT0109]MBR1352146.1 twin-arginine translocat